MRTFAQKQNQPQKPVSSGLARSNIAKPGLDHREHPLLHLQRIIGNQAVQRMLQTHAEELEVGSTSTAASRFAHGFSRIPLHAPAAGTIQAKLTVNTPGDIYEEEADTVAEQVMRMTTPLASNVQRQIEAEKLIQRKTIGDGQPQTAPPIVHEVLRSSGQPLDSATRGFMEPRVGHDFSRVRVHTGAAAEQSALEVNAHAYTVGHNIVFGAGRFAPGAQDGRRLIAHELTHVVQQSISDAGTAASMHGAPVVQRQPAKARQPPAAETWSEVEKGAYNNIVAAQKELKELLADFNSKKLKFDDRRITEKLERAFLYLREAWRTKVPVGGHAKLKAALASYSRAAEEVGVSVVLLPETEIKEDARFSLENLRWLEVRMTPPKPTPAPTAQAVTDLRQDMERQIDNWKEACRAGIGEFVHGELASRIDALSEGSWESFFPGARR